MAIYSTAFDTFASDPGRVVTIKADITLYDRLNATTTTLRVATQEYATLPVDSPANQPYDAILVRGVDFVADSFTPGTVGPWALPGGGADGGVLVLGNHHGELDDYLDPALYAWDGRACVVRVGGYSPILGRTLKRSEEAARYFIMDGASFGVGPTIDVRLRDSDEQFLDDLQFRNYLSQGWMYKGDGSSSAVNFGNVTELRITDALTLQCRIIYKSNGLTNQHLMGWTSTPWRLGVNSSGAPFLSWKKSTVTVTKTMSSTLTSGVPYLLECKIAGALVTMRIIPEETRAVTEETFSGSAGEFHTRDDHAGADQYNHFKAYGGSEYYAGIIEMARVWDELVDDDTLADRRYRRLNTTELADTALVQSTTYDDGSGTTVRDESSYGNHGTISGSGAWYESLFGSAEGAGGPMPVCFGPCDGIQPVLVCPATVIYQVASHSVEGIDDTYEGGTQSHDLDTAYTDVFLFLAATTTAAERDTLITSWGSYFRLGSRPVQGNVVTADLRGYNNSSTYLTKAGAIVKKIMDKFGERSVTDTDSTWTTLDTDVTYALGMYWREPVRRLDAIEYFLRSVGAITWRSRKTGNQRVGRFNGVTGTSVLTLDETNVTSVSETPTIRPVKKVSVGWKRCHTVLSPDQLLPVTAGASWDRWMFHQQEYRWYDAQSIQARRDFLLAEDLRLETAIYAETDAGDEAARLVELFGNRHQALRVVCTLEGVQVDRFDRVTLSIKNEDGEGEEIQRYGLSTGTDFIVLGMREAYQAGAEDEIHGKAELILWR